MNFANLFVNFVDDHTFISLTVIIIGLIWLWSYLASPYSRKHIVKQPYTTYFEDGQILYRQHFKLRVYTNSAADLFGYFLHGVGILRNTFFGGKPLKGRTSDEIISQIHSIRFQNKHAYLISGDQFSVLYPRNLGVFYNQLLDPRTAHDQEDWLNRQRVYLQSALYAIDGLSASRIPKTTLVPVGPRSIVSVRVHPGDYGSDAVYGVLYAISKMLETDGFNGRFQIRTQVAAKQILKEKQAQLAIMVKSYLNTVRDLETGLIRSKVKLASARDGVSRSSSFYDNIILWKTLSLAKELGVYSDNTDLRQLRKKIDETFWDAQSDHYHNDLNDESFSSDWLIGYVTNFFKLENKIDLTRAQRIIDYIEKNELASPLPIKYQLGEAKKMPFIIRLVVASYGSNAIWSYWGAQYITLLADMHKITGDNKYLELAKKHIKAYEKVIVRDGGFAETFTPDGKFLRTLLYKSIRVTGWVVQFEHAKKLISR